MSIKIFQIEQSRDTAISNISNDEELSDYDKHHMICEIEKEAQAAIDYEESLYQSWDAASDFYEEN